MPKQPTHVRLIHRDGREWDCPVRAVDHWTPRGWRPADEPLPQGAHTDPEPDQEPEPPAIDADQQHDHDSHENA